MSNFNQRVKISEMKKRDLRFLHELWHTPKVMRYADEFPYFRGWSKSDDPEFAWEKYQEQQRKLGKNYTQLIIRLKDDMPIGESFFCLLPDNRKNLGRWKIQVKSKCFIADIKLQPSHWGKGLGTEGMRQVVKFVFNNTNCDIFIVPPHKDNPAAIRVYEKAGFVPITGKKGAQLFWAGHLLMKLTRERFNEIYH